MASVILKEFDELKRDFHFDAINVHDPEHTARALYMLLAVCGVYAAQIGHLATILARGEDVSRQLGQLLALRDMAIDGHAQASASMAHLKDWLRSQGYNAE